MVKTSIDILFQKLFNYIAPDKHHKKLIQFTKFALVGFTGLIIDASTVYLLCPLIGLTISTLIAYFIAATSNWFINRFWTFNGLGKQQYILYQWIKFIIANSMGFFLNRGTVFILFSLSTTCLNHPIIALIAGAAAGMLANFNLSRKLVYTNKFSKKTRK
ncbi:GtrA family protein [Commensalibacter papalotli (ex Botero et al. 2024)]|uniref:Flippase GtrA (Transmembrane translocase of bactoprenol-linked glucose) (GtrA) (PDB:5MLZ) (PUBMED:24710389) n=1 Tax=Commensalibacter papalotli (ex Botero et al. 2024) TaxID=2972766 RepID=A0ABM9HN81_9PROT|nr:GtrA family protein [Commensalibacter papalotli (ex Botero et al. 2024)]CAI3936305.1 Putative flippase GtrA (transmembrane translocase of bactoprenol-linked glucose) (GtrA) (PDB:5MLZ) (PUBMED:24710389) [Commensalibacter papalotli (ex Botero et al. 2024)]CAI3939370.1 Putative flippase GtrA (transmembrane translocase of bactoprenol-linked glucose) (GtrA) (PDB:5MLZ) (PUBMED:24710389) [Commensalibacter papalotli (ex Botero et al. 2024)]